MTYTKIYKAVPDADAEEVRALGAIKATSEEMEKHKIQLKPGMSAWYYVDKDPILFAKWAYITCEVVPEYFDAGPSVTYDDDDDPFDYGDPSVMDDDPFGAIAEREFDRRD